jgi:phosphatidylglycerol lysyltransferase
MRRVRQEFARHPVTLVLLLTVAGLALATSPLRMLAEDEFRVLLGMGIAPLREADNLWSLLTFGLFADSPAELALALLMLVACVGIGERLMGRWRTAVAFVATPALGALATIGLEAGGVLGLGEWDDGLPIFDPFAPLVGVVLTASAYANPLWRRRIRILGFTALLVMILYSGTTLDLVRLLSALAGLVLGTVIVPARRRVLRWVRSSQHEARTLLSALLIVIAAGPLVAVAGLPWGLQPLGPLFRSGAASGADASCPDRLAVTASCLTELSRTRFDGLGPVLLSILPLLVLGVAAYGLLRGRRIAAWLAIVLNLLFSAVSALYFLLLPAFPDAAELPRAEAAAATLPVALAIVHPLVIAGILVASLTHFPVKPSRRSARRYGITVAAAAVGSGVLYLAGGWLLRDQFEPPVTLLDLALDLPERYLPTSFLSLRVPDVLPSGAAAEMLYAGVGPLFWAVLLAASAVAVLKGGGRAKASDLDRVRALLHQEGIGSLSHMATWQNHEYWFTSDGRAAVAYRRVAGAAITTGGPIGPDCHNAEAVLGFARFCDLQGWAPIFYGIPEELRSRLDRSGWSTAGIGGDAVLDPARFSLRGKRFQDVRTSLNRAAKLGVTTEWTSWERLSLAARTQIEVISEEWVAARNLPEMGFTLGGVDELRDPEVGLLLAVSPTGRIEAVTSWLPTYRSGALVGWTLDVMRRRGDSMNGVVEVLIARTMQLAAERELEFVSLSAAPLAGVEAASDADLTAQVLGFLGRRLDALYGFRSLLAFKSKFRPEFRPLYLAYPDAALLPAVGIAIARAYLPRVSVRQAVVLIRSLLFAPQPTTPSREKVPAL